MLYMPIAFKITGIVQLRQICKDTAIISICFIPAFKFDNTTAKSRIHCLYVQGFVILIVRFLLFCILVPIIRG